MEKNDDEMPLPYVKALSSEVKETKKIIAVAHQRMEKRKVENQEYYEPAKSLFYSVKNTRQELSQRADAVLQKIKEETDQLTELNETNLQCLQELMASEELLNEKQNISSEQPITTAVRAISAMFPFVIFGLFVVCSKRK